MICRSAVRTLAAIALAASPLTGGDVIAQDFRPKNSITTEAAEAVADACLAWYRDQSDQRPPTVWLLDVDGVSVVVKRADGATRAAVEAARVKAEIALYSGRPSRAVQDLARVGDGSSSLAGIVEDTLIGVFLTPGGLPIIVDGEVVGAVGVAGMVPDPTHDDYPNELCAQAGLDEVFPR